MPWRDRPTPYAVWISEIMLQQTQVDTVMPYFRRFMKRFPSLKRLATAREQDVLKAWEGLGYYTRARNLHRAAREVVAGRGGRLPRTAEVLRELPGIGEYTAAAIASIAYGEAVPTVDGNVLRVMARFRGLPGDITRPDVRREIRDVLAPYVPHDRPGDFNQAVMELGALVCRPRNPDCGNCPLRRNCVARRTGTTDRLPVKRASRSLPRREAVAGLIMRRGRLLLSQRTGDRLLGGLWEFPGGWREGRERLVDAARRALVDTTGLCCTPGQRLCAVQHAFSHFRLTLHVFECLHVTGRIRTRANSLRWVHPDDIRNLPLTRTTLKVLEALHDLAHAP